MIFTSITEPEPFVPPWRTADPAPPTYLLRAGSVIERSQIEAELSGRYRAGKVYGFELLAAIKDGVSFLLSDDPGLDDLIALIDAEADGEEVVLSVADKQSLAQVRQILGEHWPEYANLIAQMERRREIAPVVAFQRFCVGWSNVKNVHGDDVPFVRNKDGQVADHVLRQIDGLELATAGSNAYSMQYVSQADQGNSQPPEPSDSGQANSTADDMSAEVGSSGKRSGPKTPGSPRPRKSSRS